MFQGLKLYVNPRGIVKPKLEMVLERFKERNGEIVKEISNCNVVLTMKPIPTYVCITPEFISDSILSGKSLELPKVMAEPKKRKLAPTSPAKEISNKKRAMPKAVSNSSTPELAVNEAPNLLILKELEKLVDRYSAQGDKWRLLSYRKAINAIKKHPHQLLCGDDALELDGVGKSIADKIEEIISTGKLMKNEILPVKVPILKLFMGIYGVGSHIANKWYDEGMRTLQDIENRDDLSKPQKLGLLYYDELNERIPRSEASEIEIKAQNAFQKADSGLNISVVGSYLRGNETLGDIDFLVYATDDKLRLGLIDHCINILQDSGLLTDILSKSTNNMRGIGRLNNGKHRRMDILLTKKSELGAALIYFTGNDIFNRKLRKLADSKGMHLNEHGLYLKGENSELGKKIAGSNEQEIFELLGVSYLLPTERNV